MDSPDKTMDAVEHLTLTRKFTVRIFVFMVLAFLLFCGVFGLVRRSADAPVSQGDTKYGSAFDGIQGRP